MQIPQELNHPVVLFDGVCNLCNASVQKLIRYDPGKKFRYASLQSSFGQKILNQYQLPGTDFNTFILLENNRIYTKSTAALKLAKEMSGLWPLLYVFMIVPPFIRNFFYDIVARNRYKWFGKQETCWLPTPELKELFYT